MAVARARAKPKKSLKVRENCPASMPFPVTVRNVPIPNTSNKISVISGGGRQVWKGIGEFLGDGGGCVVGGIVGGGIIGIIGIIKNTS